MIWIWIASAVVITLFLLRGKKIAYHHFIWIMLPIDFYGLHVAGVTIKPYMIFTLLILMRNLIRSKNKLKVRIRMEWALGILFLLLMVMLADLFNGSGITSVMQHMMFLLVFVCAFIYINSIESYDEIIQIKDTIVATAVGFGLVYLFAAFSNMWNLDIAGINTLAGTNPGINVKFVDVPDGRLRGFYNDPNVFATSLIPAMAYSIYQLFGQKKEKKFIYIAQVLISLFCCYFTKSRMAILGFLIVITFTIIGSLKFNNSKRITNSFIVILWILFTLAPPIVVFGSDALDNSVGNLLQQYNGRSEFSDTYGRGTVWKSAWDALVENNLFFGVGQGQVMNFSVVQRDSHNTWLEWVTGSGIIAGSLVDLYFLLIFIRFSKYCRRRLPINYYQHLLYGTKWAYLGIVIILLSVSNITNSYLIFTVSLMIFLMSMWGKDNTYIQEEKLLDKISFPIKY